MINLTKKLLILFSALGNCAWALSPPNLNTDIVWADTGGIDNSTAPSPSYSGVVDIVAAFNHARRQEETQLGLSVGALGDLSLPSQADWDSMTDDAKALLILNAERVARKGMQAGVIGLPFTGVESHIDTIAKNYGDLLHDTDQRGHFQSSNNPNIDSPTQRIEQDADIGSLHRANISYTNNNAPVHQDNSAHFYGDAHQGSGACHEFITRSENLAYFATTGSSIPLPLERAIYNWIYADIDSFWGHREAALIQDEPLGQPLSSHWGFLNNYASAEDEGFLGIYVRGSSNYRPFSNFASNYGVLVVMNIFDPVSASSGCHYNVTLDSVNTTNVQGKAPTFNVPRRTWVLMGLNGAVGTGSTVADIFGDDVDGIYGADWVVYGYDASGDNYQKLSLTDPLLTGVGFWFAHVNDSAVIIDMPESSSGVHTTHTASCTSSEGCFEVPLQVNASATQWQVLGYPFRDSREISQVKIVTGTGDCSAGCTLTEAQAAGVIADKFWRYNGTSYQPLSGVGSDALHPWDGVWVSILTTATDSAPKVLLPAAN